MSTKSRIIEKVNKRMDMISESMPPPLTFTESEVWNILNEIQNIDYTNSNPNPSEEEINEIYADKEVTTTKFKIKEAYWNACRKKGRSFGGGAPEGAFY